MSQAAGKGLWHGAGEEDGPGIAAAALPDKEHYVLSALELRLHLAEVLFAVHRLAVDLEDDVAAAESDVLTEGVRLHVLHDHSLVGRDVETRGDIGCDVADGDTELGILRLGVVGLFVFFSNAVAEELG